MAWTTPRTWTTSELVTASIMNTHIRDNLNYLYSGKEAFYVPASAMRAATTNPCGGVTQTELTAGQAEIIYRTFDKDADEFAIFQVVMPKKWNLGTVSFQASWFASDANSTGVTIGLDAVAVADGEDMDVAFGTTVVITDNQQANQYDLLRTAESASVTIAGTPGEGDMINFRVSRDVSDVNDNLAADLWLAGITIYFTSNQHFEA
ncbi:MAG: hypothetical protein O3B43_06485 [Chloroflexi bacterium]|nr:hypothetical protein [Chloroflexota bacterium]